MFTLNPTQTIYTFCRVCECRLNTPEEWGRGLCASHASNTPSPLPETKEPDWHAILEAIDASDPRADGRGMHRD
jgi:hypothetical protein